ncbi:hypothetical protein [Salipiger sp.]|uniref:hypothetical protein n=1 Tax=Salipiger sp. TaxID=2078585 RepID=UPI003A97E114
MAETIAAGTDLAPCNTTQSALDMRAVMSAPGYPEYNAFGLAYGTKPGQGLLRSAPEGLRSLVIDSISRVDNPGYDTNGVPVDQALGWMVDYYKADTACAAAYPDLEETIHAAGRHLSGTVLQTNIPDTEKPRPMALLSAMTEEDVAAFCIRAKTDSADITSQARMMCTLGIIACQEDYPFNSREG